MSTFKDNVRTEAFNRLGCAVQAAYGAQAIFQNPMQVDAKTLIDAQNSLARAEEAISGVQDIIAEALKGNTITQFTFLGREIYRVSGKLKQGLFLNDGLALTKFLMERPNMASIPVNADSWDALLEDIRSHNYAEL